MFQTPEGLTKYLQRSAIPFDNCGQHARNRTEPGDPAYSKMTEGELAERVERVKAQCANITDKSHYPADPTRIHQWP
jgi:hypothetical protein